MAQKFEYDESGSTFFYFILSFLALILIPATFYFWPKKKYEGMHKVSYNIFLLLLSIFLKEDNSKFKSRNVYECLINFLLC